jgi:hypothetical protein
MNSEDKNRVIKKVDIGLLLYLFLWVVFLNFSDYFGKFLPLDIKDFISRVHFGLMLTLYLLFLVCLYCFIYLRNRLSFRVHLILLILIIISSAFVFLSVFTRYVALFVIFMLIMLIVILIQKRRTKGSGLNN